MARSKKRKGSSTGLKKTRKRMGPATAPDFNSEDYNIRSPERTQLLTQIKEVLRRVPVSPAFWACCQLADMNCLRGFKEAQTEFRDTFISVAVGKRGEFGLLEYSCPTIYLVQRT